MLKTAMTNAIDPNMSLTLTKHATRPTPMTRLFQDDFVTSENGFAPKPPGRGPAAELSIKQLADPARQRSVVGESAPDRSAG